MRTPLGIPSARSLEVAGGSAFALGLQLHLCPADTMRKVSSLLKGSNNTQSKLLQLSTASTEVVLIG